MRRRTSPLGIAAFGERGSPAPLPAAAGTAEIDQAAGFTTAGPHRDDLLVSINALPARTYGSQGQQRSAALALKLAEAALLEEATGEKPVALLDDVMSELDAARQDYILNRIRDWQVFVTCCESGTVLRLDRGNRNSRAWRIRSGALNEEEKGKTAMYLHLGLHHLV